MKRISLIKSMSLLNRTFMILALGLASLTSVAKDRLVVSKAPAGIELKNDFKVQARTSGGEWQDIDTYAFKVDRVADAKHNVEVTSVAKFEFEGKIEIQVKSIAQDIKSYKIRPISYGIEAKQEGNTLTFSLNRPRYLSVEINGNIYQNLQIFADNVLEKPKVKKKKNLMYFGPYTVPLGSYFVMGDNRNDSWDARYWKKKNVEKKKIIGKVKFRYFPNPSEIK